MAKIKAYISHRISDGGVDASTSMEENCKRAIKFGKYLRKEFPHIYWYVPADHEEFVQFANEKGLLTIPQILDVDCAIISTCNFLVIFSPDDYISRGMRVEVDYCTKHRIPIISAIDGSYEAHVKKLVYAINCQLTSMLR